MLAHCVKEGFPPGTKLVLAVELDASVHNSRVGSLLREVRVVQRVCLPVPLLRVSSPPVW